MAQTGGNKDPTQTLLTETAASRERESERSPKGAGGRGLRGQGERGAGSREDFQVAALTSGGNERPRTSTKLAPGRINTITSSDGRGRGSLHSTVVCPGAGRGQPLAESSPRPVPARAPRTTQQVRPSTAAVAMAGWPGARDA